MTGFLTRALQQWKSKNYFMTEGVKMARKAKIKSSYKASGSSFDCFCTISVRKSKSRGKMRGKASERGGKKR